MSGMDKTNQGVSAAGNNQRAPYPHELKNILAQEDGVGAEKFRYLPDWKFSVEYLDRGDGCEGLTLVIELHTPDSRAELGKDRAEYITVHHLMPIPAVSWTAEEWRRWLLDQILLVHGHEAREFFTVECQLCEGRGGWAGDFTKRSGERGDWISCKPCEGSGRVHPFSPNHRRGFDPYR